MYTLSIPDMTCGHCERVVTETACAIDPQAKVTVDLGRHEARIETRAALPDLLGALAAEGYPAEPV